MSTRPYRMSRRADTTAATRHRILDAAVAAFAADPETGLTLGRIAAGAGVSVQTVLRHFGSRDGVFEAAFARESGRVAAERDPAAVSSPAAAVAQLVAHYEARGDGVLRMLADEHRSPAVARVVEYGRDFHRDWCEAVFAESLARCRPADRPRRLAQLAAVCDVYVWKVLRRDRGLDRAETERALLELVRPLLEGA